MNPSQCTALARTPAGLWQLTVAALTHQISRLRDGRFLLKVAATEHPFRSVEEMHFHPRPELVIQVAGVTQLALPEDVVQARAGKVVLTPRGVPHRERNGSDRQPFCNLVFMYEDRGFTFHAALDGTDNGQPDRIGVVQRAFVPVKNGGRLYGYLNEAAAYFDAGCTPRHPAIQGLMLTHLGLLRDAVSNYERPEPVYSPLVAQARQLALQNLANLDLSVKWLASKIPCSADYLSHLFRVETGQMLTQFINDERLQLAVHLLQGTTMNISEVAAACGYRDPSYFSRVFTKKTGQSPRTYRRSHAVPTKGGAAGA